MPHVCGDEPIESCYPAGVEFVCPTYVGMNRKGVGDGKIYSEVCPTYVGMNRTRLGWRKRRGRMPHVCGDEPGDAKY